MASDSGKPPSPILLLKDYLRDDLSSCSSSGFKSLPRRRCCLQYRSSSSSSSSSCAMKSALQKASEAVLHVIKSLQIPAPHRSPGSSLSQTRTRKANKGVLSRSFSRRLLRREFWRRASSKGDSKPRTFVSAASSASASDNNTWVDTDFTCSLTAAEDSTNIEGSVTTTTTTTCSVTNSTREWPNEEKEQFSPVSVLDWPLFDDDGEEITSAFNSTPCSSLEGAKHKQMQKSRHFNPVASLKPVALEERMSSWSEMQGNEPTHNLLCDNVEEKARHLLNHVKRSTPSSNSLRIEEENMLFDFFEQSIGDINNDVDNSMKRHLCKVAEDWIRGQHHEEQYLSWEAWEGRELYIMEMDKCGSWRNSDGEIECVAVELEVEFFTCLVNELLLDLTTC